MEKTEKIRKIDKKMGKNENFLKEIKRILPEFWWRVKEVSRSRGRDPADTRLSEFLCLKSNEGVSVIL